MNTTTATRVPSPTEQIAPEAPAPNLPETIAVMAARAPEPMRDLATGDPISLHGHTATKEFGEVVGAIAAVMSEIQPVGKGGENTFHNYKYARMQDILQGLTPLMGKHGIVVFQYEAARNMFDDGKVMAITYHFIVAHKSGQTWINPVPQTGMSPCRTSKNTFDDKAFAKCHTSARKYFLLSLFQIPTEDEQGDTDAERALRDQPAAPVPGPDGRKPPHRIPTVRGETPRTWADKYLAEIRVAPVAELLAWDNANDDLLAMLADKASPISAEVSAEFERLRTAGADKAPPPAKPDPISSGPAQADIASAQEREAPFTRPEGCPDAEKDPDGFMDWAEKRLRDVAGRKNAEELTLVWEQEVTPATDGLFKPDCDKLDALFQELLGKIGG